MTQPKAKPRTGLTNADYMAMTPPANSGPRYQLINGELTEMPGATLAPQSFLLELSLEMSSQVRAAGIGRIVIAPYDVHIDPHNTFQPDLMYVSDDRLHILDQMAANGAPDVVVEILSASTRRRDLNEKLPVYVANGVREVWIVDLEATTVTIHADDGSTLAPIRTFGASDTLVSDATPGIAIDLAPIFSRALAGR